jgi:predicted DCC family thiol-disulfide oxidoreductase YuxK
MRPANAGNAETLEDKSSGFSVYRVLYDGRCEICQACVSWLKTLDRKSKNQTIRLAISAEVVGDLDSRLKMDECLRQLHVVTPEGEIHAGWEAVTCLARLFQPTRRIGILGQWSRFVVRDGCSTSSSPPTDIPWVSGAVAHVASQSSKRCENKPYSVRLVVLHTRLFHSGPARGLGCDYGSGTYHKRLDLLNLRRNRDRSGSPRMRASLAQHLRRVNTKISKIVATHAHEEHVGNRNWLSDITSAPIYLSEMTARFLTPFKKLPWVRATIIGQPPNLKPPFALLGKRLGTETGTCK